MPPGEAPPPSGVDRIGDLPDGVLHHILGFLPAQEAVRTCVLARRWRHLWNFVTGLRITSWDWQTVVPMHLLLHRGRAPIDEFELNLAGLRGSDLELDNLPVVSRHLAKLELRDVKFMHSFLDFSSCPVLEHLEIVHCDLSDSNAKKISSQSLKHINISRCNFSRTFHTHFYAPNLPSLGLVYYTNRTPVFEDIPLLTEAVVGVTDESGDWNTCPRFDDSNNCMLPQALSQAKRLVLKV
uniref:F-box family-1 n=1 Tax=Oryza coarctata TaxID=77588 RepID=E0CWA1_ORYCO|nr:F-box family-1 [Oryza coarctata]